MWIYGACVGGGVYVVHMTYADYMYVQGVWDIWRREVWERGRVGGV